MSKHQPCIGEKQRTAIEEHTAISAAPLFLSLRNIAGGAVSPEVREARTQGHTPRMYHMRPLLFSRLRGSCFVRVRASRSHGLVCLVLSSKPRRVLEAFKLERPTCCFLLSCSDSSASLVEEGSAALNSVCFVCVEVTTWGRISIFQGTPGGGRGFCSGSFFVVTDV